MDKQLDKKFTWTIKDFSSLESENIYSDRFLIGSCEWRIQAFPKGNKNTSDLSLYLVVPNSKFLPPGWRRHANFSFTIVNQIVVQLSRRKETQQWFNEKDGDWGFRSMFPLDLLKAKNSGFLVNGEIKIVAEIEVFEVVGQLDVPESMNVNGFHVLPSQVNFVNRLFERHPDIAKRLHTSNQYLKTGYMNVLLRLTETLRRSPKEISKHDLADAYAALESMTITGFKLDWLEKKLDQVSKKKVKMEAGEIRIQEIEEELKDLKRKSSDLEAQLEKEKAEVLAAEASLSWSDD